MRMNSLRTLGIVMLVLGLAALAYQGMAGANRQTFFHIGPLTLTREQARPSRLPPLAGLVVAATGVILLLVGARKTE
jgi:hypothetical protein